jgi:hypothetical protein
MVLRAAAVEGYLHLLEQIEKRVGPARGILTILLVMLFVPLADGVARLIIDHFNPPWSAVAGSVNLCAPSNIEDLKQHGVNPCRVQAGRRIALIDLPPGLELRYDAPPKTYFRAFQLEGIMFLKESGSGLRISALDSSGATLRIDNFFAAADSVGQDGPGTQGTGIPKFFTSAAGNAPPVPEMQNTPAFPGYTTFGRPDFERFTVRFDGKGVAFDQTLAASPALGRRHRCAGRYSFLSQVGARAIWQYGLNPNRVALARSSGNDPPGHAGSRGRRHDYPRHQNENQGTSCHSRGGSARRRRSSPRALREQMDRS